MKNKKCRYCGKIREPNSYCCAVYEKMSKNCRSKAKIYNIINQKDYSHFNRLKELAEKRKKYLAVGNYES